MSTSDKRPRLRVAVYCRISLARGDQVKVERQEEDCRTLCRRLGWDVRFVFVDNSKSAWQRNRKRPGWDALLECVDAGSVDAIVVYHGDRLIRQPWDLELLLRLADEKGIRLASPVGSRNLDSADDRFILRIEAAQACRESDNISRRTKRGHEARVANGIPAKGGTRSFGFERDMGVCEPEASVVREVAFRVLAGEPISALMKELNTRGVRTPTGKAWEYTAFRKMLTRPKLAGLVSHHGRVAGPGNWTPVLDRDTWEALQGALGLERSDTPPPLAGRKYLLSGIAVCASCEATLVVRQHTTPGLLRYRCTADGCPRKVGRNLAHLDAYVIGAVLARLADGRLWEQQGSATESGAGNELAAIEARRVQVAEEFGDEDEMDPALLRKVLARLDARAGEVRARIDAARGTRVLAGLRNLDRPGWNALPLDRRRAVVRELVAVTVGPSKRGPGFDEASVAVVRRPVA